MMTIVDRNLKPGDVLVATYKEAAYRCDVIQGDTKLAYWIQGHGHGAGKYTSPSAAGGAVTGSSCNGWAFWSKEGEEPPAKEPKAKRPRDAKAWENPVVSVPPSPKGGRSNGATGQLCSVCDVDLMEAVHYHTRKADGTGHAENVCCDCTTDAGYTCDEAKPKKEGKRGRK